MGSGQFLTAIGIAVDEQGNVYATDKGNRKIEKFDSDGILIKSLPFRWIKLCFSPTIMAPSDLILEATSLFTPVSIGDAIANYDDSGIRAILNNTPEEFSLRVNKVTWIAFDNAGNTAETYQMITILVVVMFTLIIT